MKLAEIKRLIANTLRDDFIVYAPVKTDGQIFVEKIKNGSEIDWSSDIPAYPFKSIFLPPRETMFHIKDGIFKEKFEKEKAVVWGINILDLRAFTLFEHVFAKDIYFQKRRQNMIIVGYANGIENDLRKYKVFQPEYEENVLEHLLFDVFIERQKDGNLLLFSGTQKGQKFLEKNNVKDYENIEFAGLVPEQGVNPRIIAGRQAVENNEKHQLWNELSEICLACGKCSIVCPTCFCFNQVDEPQLNGVRKERHWANCFYPEFSKIAGGFKKLDTVAKRLYFWYFHKFVRIPEEFSYYGCVGCGRCVKACPVGIDIFRNLKTLSKS
ncbi:MAG: 4Fe-4S dicluster domain-containing protein [Parcubacteria group bacterium]